MQCRTRPSFEPDLRCGASPSSFFDLVSPQINRPRRTLTVGPSCFPSDFTTTRLFTAFDDTRTTLPVAGVQAAYAPAGSLWLMISCGTESRPQRT